MRVRASFTGLLRRDVGDSLLADLRAIMPDGRESPLAYLCTVPVDDPRFEQLKERLRRAGFEPKVARGRQQDRTSEYRLVLWREYDPSDFADCRLVEFLGFVRSKVKGGQSDGLYKLASPGKDGVMEINEGELDPKHSFLRCINQYFCSDRAKRTLETEKFIGLAFKLTRLRKRVRDDFEDYELGEVIPWQDWGQPWWEMVAQGAMPPLSESMTFLESRLNECDTVHPPLDDPNYCYTPLDGLYTPVELRYRESDLDKAASLDYARTLEKLGAMHQPVIVSRRFYDCCQTHGLESDWGPVRVDPG